MQKGDFVEIDYVGRIAATNEIFDLTIEEIAKAEGVYNEKHKYGPALVIMGADMVVPGIEKRLEEMKPGDEKEFLLKPEEAFGRRDTDLIKIISMAQFIKQKINPVPGMFVTINGVRAKVQNVTGGRIRADFNHPLAGKELKYRLKLVKKIDGTLEKAREIIGFYGIKAEFSMEGEKLMVSTVKPLPEIIRKLVEEKVREWIKEIKQIHFSSKEKKESETTALGSVSLEAEETPETEPAEEEPAEETK